MAACDSFLGKPVQIGELLQTLERLLQLKWDRDPSDTGVVGNGEPLPVTAVPLPEVLASLRRTIERGEFGKLERLLRERASDASYAGFCAQIRQLAARFDDEGIAAFLNQVGEDHNDDGNR